MIYTEYHSMIQLFYFCRVPVGWGDLHRTTFYDFNHAAMDRFFIKRWKVKKTKSAKNNLVAKKTDKIATLRLLKNMLKLVIHLVLLKDEYLLKPHIHLLFKETM